MVTINIVIIESDSVVHKYYQSIFYKVQDIVIVGCYANLKAFVSNIDSHKNDLILLDVHSTEGYAETVILKLVKQHPEIRMVILSAWIQYDLVYDCIKAGAIGHIGKFVKAQSFIRTIREIYKGESRVSLPLAQLINENILMQRIGKVSIRNMQMLALFSGGYTMYEILKFMNMAEHEILCSLRDVILQIHFTNRNFDL
ncbi:MAG TPA: response regulator [Bacteroidia bacterium]|nr:response regulator [Bacteroidia bacterium]